MDVSYVDRYITIVGQAHLEAALQQRRGLMFLTGHFGNWELSSVIGAIKGYPTVVLAREQKFPRLDRLLRTYREMKGCRVVGKGMALRGLVQALRDNHIVGIVGDQGAKTTGIPLQLFGRDTLTPIGPLELAVRTGAIVLPTFITRTHGPYHTIEVEPPLDLTARPSESPDAVISRGLQTFLQRLEVRVTTHPGQWLWMHRRWKSTTRRHALVISDGKAGHLKQSLAIVEALRTIHPHLTHDTIAVAFHSAVRRLVATLATWFPGQRVPSLLSWALSSGREVLDRPCDYVISCGAATAPVNLLVARDNAAKAIVAMRPSLVPLRQFALALLPAHDRPPRRANVVVTTGAVSALTPARLEVARQQFVRDQRLSSVDGHAIGVLWGGDSEDVRWTPALVEQLLAALEHCCRSHGAVLWMTTSRRTTPAIEQLCVTRLQAQLWCPVLIVANRANLTGAVEGILGTARVVIVSGESSSMISEAVASGRPVIVVTPHGAQGLHAKRQALLQTLQAMGRVRVVTVEGLADAVAQMWTAAGATEPTAWHTLCEAVQRLR